MKIICDLIILIGISLCNYGLLNAESVNVVELNKNWTLINQNETIRYTNIKIPTGVYSALTSQNSEDVLYSYNDIDRRWISYDNWTYSNVFYVNMSIVSNMSGIHLTFHGVDTIAEIHLNGEILGRTDNMFVRYSYDVLKLLKDENLLEVKITSPVYAAKAKALALNQEVPPACPHPRYHGECHMNMLRKMQASFSWDWGLAAPSMGIWKPVTLELYDVAVIRDIDAFISKNVTHWQMKLSVYMDVVGQQDFFADLTFYAVELLQSAVIITDYRHQPISYKRPVITFEQSIPINDVITWWPNGFGEQKLYPLHFTLKAWTNPEGPSLRAKTTSQKSIRVGFRTIELVEEPIENGNSFLFKVNDKEIFMKGTNYIPSHILPEYGNERNRINHLLRSAKEAHMNMIRVWGGGIYESDYFYDLADTYGLLIWQDMMFACAMYPVDKEFLASVKIEVIQNARRLAHHASIAIFATNNENEAALSGNWYNTAGNLSRFKDEYRKLYLGTVMHELKTVAHSSRPTPLVSSPSNGKESAKDNYISANPQDVRYGDVHFYEVIEDGWDPSIYPRPRFSSEYGFQGLPSLLAWNRSIAVDDNLLEMIEHRQHYPLGMIPILTLIHRHLPLPLPEDAKYAEALIYFSQIAQAMATKTETEVYRSLRDTHYKTMGALYWQLNDVWIAPSWSSIDFYGNYKLLHHWAIEFMAPISIIVLYDSKTSSINISLTCDYFEVDTEDLKVTANTYLWSELYPKRSITWPVTLRPNGVHYDKVIPLKDIFNGPFTQRNSFVKFILHRGHLGISRTFYIPPGIKRAEGVKDPNISVKISMKTCNKQNIMVNSFSLIVTVERPAIFVYIEIDHPKILTYKLSRNGYMQVTPVQIVHLELEAENCVNLNTNNIKILTVNQFMM